MNATVIVALITAIAAILAPLITAVINNRYQLQIRKIELYEEKRIIAINQYVSLACKYLNHPSEHFKNELSESKQTIFLYAPKSTWEYIESMNTAIDSGNLEEARKLLPRLSQELSPSVIVGKK